MVIIKQPRNQRIRTNSASIRRRRSEYSTIFTETEENNCFSIIAQVIIRAIAFSFILFVSSSKTSINRAVPI